MRRLIIPLLGCFSLLASCNSNSDVMVSHLDSPDGRTRLELRDFGDGKVLYLSSNERSAGEKALLVRFGVCSNVAVGWSETGGVVVAFDDLEATYANTYSRQDGEPVGVMFCTNGHAGCAAPIHRLATIAACE